MSCVERDSLGERELPDDVYYGVQTLRAKENFHITELPVSRQPALVKSFGYVKKAAALANMECGVLDKTIGEAIIKACDRIIDGEFLDQFITDCIQGGAGTSVNMNANEVIANVALEMMGKLKGDYATINPNDHVNCSQSTNDTYPTAFRLALVMRLRRYAATLERLRDAFREKGTEFGRVLKMGRTHLQDAVPMSLGMEFNGFATNIDEEIGKVNDSCKLLCEINLGATAIGTKVNAPPCYPEVAVNYLRELTGMDELCLASDLIEATSDTGAYVQLSGVIKRTAVKLTKICNDLRLLSSGPRCGFNEINLPRLQPGSSIMPGKVNPVIPEVVNQSAFLVIGLDTTVALAASAGQLQLNVMEPVIAFALFSSINTMQNAVKTLVEKCVVGITANAAHTEAMVMNSIGIITQLSPILGYKKCSEIAKEAFEQNKSLHDVVVTEQKLITQEKWDELFSFENLINPQYFKA